MFEKVDLLTKNNIIRHIQKKISKLSDISLLAKTTQGTLDTLVTLNLIS